MHPHLSTMLATPLLLLLLTTPPGARAVDFPACVDTCITENPMLSPCNGDETGAALDQCLCADLDGTPLITCIKTDCDAADQNDYAQGLPELCRYEIFPEADGPGSSTGTATATVTPTSTSTSATESGSSVEQTDAAVALGVPGGAVVGGLVVAVLAL